MVKKDERVLDHDPEPRRRLSAVKAPGQPVSYSLRFSKLEALGTLLVILLALGSLVKGVDYIFWNLFAKQRTDEEIAVRDQELVRRLSSAVERPEFDAHTKAMEQKLESLQNWTKGVSGKVDFIFQEAYRQRYGTAPPPDGNNHRGGNDP